MEPAATITAYIVQVALGDLPHGSIGYQTIFAAGLTLVLMTLFFNVLGHMLRKRYRQVVLNMSEHARVRRDPRADRRAQALGPDVCDHRRAGADGRRAHVRRAVRTMVIDGAPRLSWDFFTSFPVAQAGPGGHTVGLGRHPRW